jgi:nardilysin
MSKFFFKFELNQTLTLFLFISDCRLTILKKNHRSFFDRYEIVDSLNYQSFKEFCGNFTESLKAKILIQGNIIESRAHYISQVIINNLKIKENSEYHSLNSSEIHQIPLGSSFLKVKSMRQHDRNSVIKNYYQIGKATIKNECMAEFLVSVINEPLFDTLRSHQQLGYGVACTLRRNNGVLGITITCEYQENINSAEKIDEKIEEFLQNFQTILSGINDKDFTSAKRSIVSLKLLADTELEKEVNRHWEEIRNGEYIFDRSELEAFETENLTKEEIVDFYSNTFQLNKRKLSVQVKGEEKTVNNEKTVKMTGDEEKCYCRSFVANVIKFKEHLEIIV